MAEARRCPECRAWDLCASDAWCGNCGAPGAQLGLTLQPYVMQVAQIAPALQFTVSNGSCADLAIERLELPAWMTAADVPLSVAAGATVRFGGRAKTMSIGEPLGAPVSVQTRAGSASALAMVIEEVPMLHCQPAELEVWGTGKQEVALSLVPRAGYLRVRAVRRGPLGTLDVVGGAAAEGGVVAQPGAGAPVSVLVDVEKFRAQPRGSLMVAFDGPHGAATVEVPVKVVVRSPPQMRWAGENDPPAERFSTVGQLLDFTVANQAPDGRDGGTRNAHLVIESATLQLPADMAAVPVRLLSPSLPATLAGGESVVFAFELDLTAVPFAPGGLLHLQLEVQAKGLSLVHRVPVKVRPLPVYDGVLAIDFGTSNTCAAVVETGREYERLRLDGGEEVSPTVLRYLSLRGAVAKIETGIRVKELAARSDLVAASTVGRLKQRLGDEMQEIAVRPYDAVEWTTRSASQAAGDYLREVRRVLEAEKHTVFRDFILTHPAVCSLRQYRNLHQALNDAFGDSAERVSFLQEPLAALIPFFAEQAAQLGASRPGAAGYTVASFDLGGGTTDLAIVRVEHAALPGERMEVRPAILYSRGVRFGGEDLTDFLAASLADRAAELMPPGASLVRKGLAGASMEDILRNRYALREAAEQFKASLSDEAASPEPRLLTLRVLSADAVGATDFVCDFARLRDAGSVDLKTLFLKEFGSRLHEVAQLLVTAETRVGKLDFVQLSGMTSYLPAVGQTLRQLFPEATVVRASDPKECVVTGACLSRSMSRGARRRLILPEGMRRTTSSVGLYDVTTASFTVLLPVDTPIPEEGLEGELAGAWFGSERIALWENLGVEDKELQEGGTRLLSKLGTWQPERRAPAAEAEGWTLRLLLQNFDVHVRAVGPGGETIPFIALAETNATTPTTPAVPTNPMRAAR